MFKLLKYSQNRHFYEVIPENYPCHLYFDIEFIFSEHKDYDGDKLIQQLISLVDDRLFSVFGRSDYELIDLEATNEKKFSRHLIFHSDSFMFRNHLHVSQFVHTEILNHHEFAAIVDPSVYSKNRNFRCIWCTKISNGKKYPLLPKDKTNSSPHLSSLDYFLKTLISYKPKVNPHLIGYSEIVDSQSIKKKTTRIPSSKPSSNNNNNQDTKIDELDLYSFAIKSFAPGGRISKESYMPQSDTVFLYVEGNRFCQKIGREHKSNHIYLVCRLSAGFITQRCLDPDCRGFESTPIEIPEQILKSVRSKYEPSNNNAESDIIQNYMRKAPNITPIEQIIEKNSFLSDD